MEYLARIVLFFFLFFKLLLSSLNLGAQNYQCILYGTITTVDGDSYQGAIRWNDEEVFLSDIFNSVKIDNPYLKYIDKKEIATDIKRRKSNRFEWIYNEYTQDQQDNTRKFKCRFGDIKSITITGEESVILELKSGKYINLAGGSNDVGNKIWIKDQELGLMKLDWNRISTVEFYSSPKNSKDSFGEPIYGKLLTTIGEFTGFIQWDHDERLLSDLLDGESRDGDVSIVFNKISQIEKLEEGSRITLNSGRNIDLYGSNDVSESNRGIIIGIPGVGRIDFPWTYFISLDLKSFAGNTLQCNPNYPESKRLYGKIYTKNNKVYEGVIVYDLDEAMDAEMLDGLNDKIEFSIPFRNIKTIQPKAYNYCLVELKNGEKLYLGDQVDVSDRSLGFLIFTDSNTYHFMKWNEIEKIELTD